MLPPDPISVRSPLSPPWVRPIRSGRARAALLYVLVAGAGLVAAALLLAGLSPLPDRPLLATRGTAAAYLVMALGALLSAAGVATGPEHHPVAQPVISDSRHGGNRWLRLGRARRGHGSRSDRILDVMAGISSGTDIEAVLTAAGGAVVDLLATRTASPVIARVFRIERDTMVVASEHGAIAGAASGESRPLSADPLIMAAVAGDHTLAEAGSKPHRVASPIHAGPAVRAVVVAERRDRAFRDDELTMIEGLTAIATLAVSNLVRARIALASPAEAEDALTGLPGRAAFERRLRSVRDPFALIAVDVDQLDQLNGALGHEAGDDALRAVARALQASIRENDIVCRTGDDEFTILTVGAATAVAGSVAERVRCQVSELAGGAFPVRVSVGWAVGAAGEDTDSVLARADEALGRAKREGRNRVAGSITGRPAGGPARGWATLLSRTLASQQINPVYQPIVTLPEARIVAYEGLARPVNLDGADNVEEFFTTAHRLGVTNELDWICRRAVVRGAETMPADAHLYINMDLSAVSDVDEDVDQMVQLLEWAGRQPDRVVLEIVDADRFSNLGQLAARVDAYRRAGFRIAIDDAGRPGIGIGLVYATHPDVIKIDAGIVRRCHEQESRRVIFECIAYAEQIGAAVVAEGIDDLGVAAELTRLGIDRGQGYLFGKPEAFTGTVKELEGAPAMLRTLAAAS